MATTKELSILAFASPATFENWLQEQHTTADGIWLKIAKKGSGTDSVTYDEALDIALCYGWIDGQRKSWDETYFVQKFTPRRTKSLWSKRNIGKVAELTAAGKMQPAGIAEVEAAKADGRWDAAYDGAKDMEFPEDFRQVLEENPEALAFFNTLKKTNVYAIAFRLATARTPATRQRRFDALLGMMERGEKIH